MLASIISSSRGREGVKSGNGMLGKPPVTAYPVLDAGRPVGMVVMLQYISADKCETSLPRQGRTGGQMAVSRLLITSFF